MKLAIQQIAAACLDGGTVHLPVTRAERMSLEPHLALMRMRFGAVIAITGTEGDFTASVRVAKRVEAPKQQGRKPSAERLAIEALEPGGSTTLQIGVMSMEGIDQKIHAVQRSLGVKLSRHYDRTTRTITVRRIDGVPVSDTPEATRFKSRGRAPKYNLRTMSPGEALFIDDGTDLRAVRSICAYHNKSTPKVEFKAVESTYDNAIEIHCLPRAASGNAVDAARRSIKRLRIARVLDGEAIFKPDGSSFGSSPGSTITGYGGVQFFASMIDDVLDVVSPNESVHFPGVQPAKLAERANHWATVRSLKPRVNGDAVWFE